MPISDEQFAQGIPTSALRRDDGLGLAGVITAICGFAVGLLVALAMLPRSLDDAGPRFAAVGGMIVGEAASVTTGVAALVLSAAAIAERRGRREGIAGALIALAAPVLIFVLWRLVAAGIPSSP